jgi:hypothetical protein
MFKNMLLVSLPLQLAAETHPVAESILLYQPFGQSQISGLEEPTFYKEISPLFP